VEEHGTGLVAPQRCARRHFGARLQPRGGEHAVDDAVVAREGDVHHALGGEAALPVRHHLRLRAAHREDARLRPPSGPHARWGSATCTPGSRSHVCERVCARACGPLMMAVNCLTPNMPRLEMVKVPPRNSSGLSCAREANAGVSGRAPAASQARISAGPRRRLGAWARLVLLCPRGERLHVAADLHDALRVGAEDDRREQPCEARGR